MADIDARSVGAALRTAVLHIEHMAAWIGKQNAGYSFEGLGEDMPAIREAAQAMGTPGARWRDEGKPDPHENRYDCERAKLARGYATDDEIANAVFLDPGIGNLTAAKDRIRWLSRALAAAQARNNG